MDKENNKKIISKIMYWAISTFIVLALFLLFFGALPLSLDRINSNPIPVVGYIISGVGLAILLLSLFRPLSLMKQFLKMASSSKPEYRPHAISAVFGLIGVSLLLGGIIYSITENSKYLVLMFVTPILFLLILNKILGWRG